MPTEALPGALVRGPIPHVHAGHLIWAFVAIGGPGGIGGIFYELTRSVPQTFMELAFEDLHLMAEHQDLDVLVPSGASCHHQVEDPTQPEVEK